MERYRHQPRGEARNSSENPHIRTVFVHNLPQDITDDELKQIAEEFGDVSSVFSLASKKGFAFITF